MSAPVTRVGVTGHTDLLPATARLVAEQLGAVLAEVPGPLVGLTCLAPGGDQLFAEVVLDKGGRIEVFLPSADYREAKVDAADRARFDALVNRADRVHTMAFPTANRAAYRGASLALLEVADRLVAVWDGDPDDRPGSTGDTVEAARARGVPVTVVWPDGAGRRAD